MKKITITLKDWNFSCGDGCCYDYGTTILLNGEEIEHPNEQVQDNRYVGTDVQTALHAVLKKLGYEVEFDNE